MNYEMKRGRDARAIARQPSRRRDLGLKLTGRAYTLGCRGTEGKFQLRRKLMHQLKAVLPLFVLLAAPIPLLNAQARVNRSVAKANVKMSAPQARALHALNESATNLEKLNRIHSETVAMNRQLLARCSALQKKLANLQKLAARPTTTRAQLADAIRQAAQMQPNSDLTMIHLQSIMQNRNRYYTSVSNMLKAQHDTMKSIINNMR